MQKYIPDPLVAARYGVHAVTLWRWDKNPALNFPPPITINKRKYRDVAALDAWDATRIANQVGALEAASTSST
jgi:hypothetical protein